MGNTEEHAGPPDAQAQTVDVIVIGFACGSEWLMVMVFSWGLD